jgi:hypothetical protein
VLLDESSSPAEDPQPTSDKASPKAAAKYLALKQALKQAMLKQHDLLEPAPPAEDGGQLLEPNDKWLTAAEFTPSPIPMSLQNWPGKRLLQCQSCQQST